MIDDPFRPNKPKCFEIETKYREGGTMTNLLAWLESNDRC